MGGRRPRAGAAGSARVRRRRHRPASPRWSASTAARWRWPATRSAARLRSTPPTNGRSLRRRGGPEPGRGGALRRGHERAAPRIHGPNTGAAHMARLLFQPDALAILAGARDFARHWGTPPCSASLDDARSGSGSLTGAGGAHRHPRSRAHPLGAEDRLLPVSSLEDFRRIEGGRVELLPGCGHVPQLEKPAFTRRAVGDFVRKLK